MKPQKHNAGTVPTYMLYGIPVQCEWELPYKRCSQSVTPLVELREGDARFFEHAREEAQNRPRDNNEWFQHVCLGDGSNYLQWHGTFEFLVSADGRQIVGRALNAISFEAFYGYLIGAVLSFSLIKLGLDPLHSTAVVVNGDAIGFLGNNGYGKSTLAGSFLRVGYPLLTDDVLVTLEDNRGFFACPGPARIKLLPDSTTAILGTKVLGIPMNQLTQKAIIPLQSHLSSADVVPLRTLYLLPTPGEAPKDLKIKIQRLSTRNAFVALAASAFNDCLLDKKRLERHFLLMSRLASHVVVKQLSYPRILSALPSVRQAILDDLRTDS
jgi:hypothetical protein